MKLKRRAPSSAVAHLIIVRRMNTVAVPFMFLPAFAFAAPVLIYGFAQADRLVRVERERYPDEWARDGFPAGYFAWIRPFFSGAAADLSRSRTSVPWRWKFKTPPWIAASPEYRRWLRRYRVCIVVWNVVCLCAFVLIALSLFHRNV
jgi:hypothetical protein